MIIAQKKNISFFLIFLITLVSLSFELRDLRVIESEDDSPKEEETLIKPPGFSKISGFYPNNFKLKLSSEEGTTIYYTVDASDPRTSKTAKEFKDYILIYDRTLEPNIYSNIKENEDSPVSVSRGNGFNGPVYPVDKAMVVRAVAKNAKGEFSEVNSKTYFVTNEDLAQYEDLTVVSIVTNPENLFDPDIGIYVTGTMYQNWKKSDEYDPKQSPWDKNGKCNFFMRGEEWEREATVTIFDKGEKIVQQNMGIRIKGASTRNNPGKSFNLHARKKYGKGKIETDIFKDNHDINGKKITTYKSLSMRCIYEQARFKDMLGRDILYDRENLSTTNMKPSILFLNGEYWGLYLLQEKLDDEFISAHYLIPDEDVAMVKEGQIEEGPEEELTTVKQFFKEYSKKDLNDEKIYEEVKKVVDINSMIEFFATGIYISIGDWPGQNEGEWRNMGNIIEGNKYGDGKWRFMIYDLDYTMGSKFAGVGLLDSDNFKFVEGRSNKFPANLFMGLLKNNTDFQQKFVNLYCDYANEVFNYEKIEKILEEYREKYTNLIAYSQLRWWGWSSKLEGFLSYRTRYLQALDGIAEFYRKRAVYTIPHMQDFLGLKGNLVSLIIEVKGRGKIIVNTITPTLKDNRWVGRYFTKIPIVLKAIPDLGYTFKGWSGKVEYEESIVEITLSETTTIVANFN
jgi:hypothetical protein